MATNHEEVKKVINWIKEYLNAAVPTSDVKAVVGLSGGIDSAVTAALCVEAVGADKVIGVILPCESPLEDTLDAVLVANHLGIHYVDLDLEGTMRSLWDGYRAMVAFPGQEAGYFPPMDKMVKANMKSRLRMTALYMVANQVHGLVVGTTNRTEAILGYATKYGDGGVDIEPLMEFLKTEVWEIGTIMNLPPKIIKRVPTASLYDGQTDEGELGMTYKEIDRYLDTDEVDDPEIAAKVDALSKANSHKDLGLPHYKR